MVQTRGRQTTDQFHDVISDAEGDSLTTIVFSGSAVKTEVPGLWLR